MRIAIVTPDPIDQELVRSTLLRLGHACHSFPSPESLMQTLRRSSFDLLVLPWPLTTTAMVAALRETQGPRLPILFVAEDASEQALVRALGSGGDDFLAKPLRSGELGARVQALGRRAYPDYLLGRTQFDPYVFDPAQRTVHCRDAEIPLKNMEFELALFMFQQAGRLLSRDHLQEAVWGRAIDIPSRSLDTHVSRMRNKLQLHPENGFVVQAVYGFGYRLDAIDHLPNALA